MAVIKGVTRLRETLTACLHFSEHLIEESWILEASVRLGPKTLRTLDEEVKSLVSAWRISDRLSYHISDSLDGFFIFLFHFIYFLTGIHF